MRVRRSSVAKGGVRYEVLLGPRLSLPVSLLAPAGWPLPVHLVLLTPKVQCVLPSFPTCEDDPHGHCELADSLVLPLTTSPPPQPPQPRLPARAGGPLPNNTRYHHFISSLSRFPSCSLPLPSLYIVSVDFGKRPPRVPSSLTTTDIPPQSTYPSSSLPTTSASALHRPYEPHALTTEL